MARGLKVASFEDIAKMDKVGIAYILMNFHVTKADLLKQNLPMDRLLNNFTAINYSIEGFLSPYIKKDNNYWDETAELKEWLVPDKTRLPQLHGRCLKKLAAWDRLLSREQARLQLFLTQEVTGRV